MTDSPGDITQYLKDYQTGKRADLDEIFPLVYGELRRIAAARLSGERREHTLQPTALVHEAYLRLVNQHSADYNNRAHFFGLAAEMMRRILVNHHEARNAGKRGAGEMKLVLDEAVTFAQDSEIDLTALDEALTDLAEFAPRQAKVIELRFFGGLSIEEAADALSETLRRAGDRDEADIYSQKSLDVGERIVAANPSETKTAYRLAAAYLARGDSLLDVDRNQSAAAYQKSFDLGEKILAANPNDLTALHIAASLAARAGDNLLAMPDRPENLQQAAVFYNRSVEAARKLTELEPENALDRQILTTAEFNRSLLNAKNGDYDRALIVQRQTLRDFVQMIERDPNNQELKSFQAEVYLGLGDTFAGKNDAAQAIQNYQRASAIYESLAAQDVNNLELRRKRENIAVKTARLNK